MRAFVLAVFVFTVGIANAQSLTAPEIVDNVQCVDITCVDSYLTKKGFAFYYSERTDSSTITSYSTPTQNGRPGNIVVFDPGRRTNTITFITAETNDFNTLLNGLKSLGFNETGKEETPYGIEYNFASVAYPYHQLRYTSVLDYTGTTYFLTLQFLR